MRRVIELIEETKHRYPKDNFFDDFVESCRIGSNKYLYYRTYDDALRVLDPKSWAILKSKAVNHFRDHREGQRKQGFFNQLNEAFAYRWLARRYRGRVQILEEDGNRKPDIQYGASTTPQYCEVKTLGISDAEIERRASRKSYDGRIFESLDTGFFRKLDSAFSEATNQITAVGGSGLVFVVLKLEDIAVDHYSNYRAQILRHCRDNDMADLYVKVGIRGRRKIHLTKQ